LEILSHRNNPPQTVWAAFFMALLTALIAWWSDDPAFSRKVLGGLAGMFALIGLFVWLWKPRRTVRLDALRQTLHVHDQTRWGSRHRQVAFRDLIGALVNEWQDPDPDSHPRKVLHYWVVVQTRQGEQIEVSDRMLSAAEAGRLCARVNALLQAGPPGA
jgi:hypothetical protein